MNIQAELERIQRELNAVKSAVMLIDTSKTGSAQDKYCGGYITNNGFLVIAGRVGKPDRFFLAADIGGVSVTWRLEETLGGAYELIPERRT